MNKQRDSKGRFSKVGSRIFGFILIAIVVAIIYQYKTTDTTVVPETTEQVKVENTGNKIDEVMNEADFKKKMELEAKKIVSEREKKAELARHDAEVKAEKEKHDAKIAEIEASLEGIRKEELSFTKAAPQVK